MECKSVLDYKKPPRLQGGPLIVAPLAVSTYNEKGAGSRKCSWPYPLALSKRTCLAEDHRYSRLLGNFDKAVVFQAVQ